MSALPRRSTQTMIGVTLSMAPRTTAIFSPERPTSTQSMPCMPLRLRSCQLELRDLFEAAELGGIFIEHRSDAAIQLQIGDRLPFRRIGLMDSLHASLQIRERPFFLYVNCRREKDVGDVVERMVRVPRHDHEELR